MDNPLLQTGGLPQYSRIRPEHVEPAIDRILADNRARLAALLESGGDHTWSNLIEPLEELEDRLNRAWSPVVHMNAVVDAPELRAAYNACLPRLSEYATELGQNEALYQACKAIADSAGYTRLNIAQRKIIGNALRDFKLSGIALAPDQRQRFKDIMQELSTLAAKFSENLLDATGAWTRPVSDEKQLAGLSPSHLAMVRQAAQRAGTEGFLLTLEFPCYMAVVMFADDRELRREIYAAYVTRASDEGPFANQWNNTPVMERLLALRHEQAQLLGYANYAELSLATKMAATPAQVIGFLDDLARRTRPVAQRDYDTLREFARAEKGIATLEAWDVAYFSEKLREKQYTISQEALRQYFPEQSVLNGLFAVVARLYGIIVTEITGVDTWHPDVRFFEVHDRHGELRGRFFLDLYARPHKRGGAWMDECINRRRVGGGFETPVAYLTCNFSSPTGDEPALFTHNEVVTLFHEFGHGLHHMLTRVEHAMVAGIRGVAWDAVELPSQFMENWCWQKESLNLIARHYKSGEPLPADMFDKMLAARTFQAGMQIVRQLEFALFDFRLHQEYDPLQGPRVYELLDEVRKQVAVFRPPSFNRFPHSFAHIFSGGYAAGYYSYKWAEVLSADAFSSFEEHGIFDAETGRRFLQTILEQGGSREPMELFIEFRGREPTLDALLRHHGIAA
ncbi:MAG: oligopeptidase A [Gammaproteobacteria bacterium]|nr:MAG: oligopeptidase A [Gammaproteobacteria bacterium]TND05754.1 MAG: oligopeptidase A [Gammaproteobacteria bacterium]